MPTSFFGWVSFLIEEYWPLFLQGTVNTLIIAITGTIIGFIIGFLLSIVRTIPVHKNDNPFKKAILKIANVIINVYVEVFRGTPMIVQAVVIYYGATQYMHLDMPALFAAIFVISINTGAYMTEIIRGGIISIDSGQKEAAYSIGMTHSQMMIHVVLPQAIRNIMPSIGNEFIINIKDSSVLNVISVTELFFSGSSAAGTYLRYFEVYFIIALIYLFLTFTVTRILRAIERRMDGPDNFVLHTKELDSKSCVVREVKK